MIDLARIATLLPAKSSVTIHEGYTDLIAAGGTPHSGEPRRGKVEVYEGAHLTINGVRFCAGRFRRLTRAEVLALLPPDEEQDTGDPRAEAAAKDRQLDSEHAA